MNRDPIGKRLLLTIVTSNVEDARTRNRDPSQTIVEITPAEYKELKVHSAVDCNVVIEKPLSELRGMVKRNEVRYHRDLPPEHIRNDQNRHPRQSGRSRRDQADALEKAARDSSAKRVPSLPLPMLSARFPIANDIKKHESI